MNAPLQVSPNQRLASDPGQSVWVSANAGSGKTHVLVDRVVRLLLSGAEPSRILCLTFTKAAAAEMANRLFGKLAEWTMLPDDQLQAHVSAIGHTDEGQVDLGRARRLFTLALESPGGLRIQTIHAFCERLLQGFPVEAGVIPGFTVMDDVLTNATLAEARQNVLSRPGDGGPAAGALHRIVARVDAAQFDELVGTLLNKRLEIADVLSGQDRVEAAVAALTAAAGLPAGTSAQAEENALYDIDAELYGELAGALRQGTQKIDAGNANIIEKVLASSDREVRRESLRKLFTTKEGQPRAESGLMTKSLGSRFPDLRDRFLAEQRRVLSHLDNLAFLDMLAATQDLLTLTCGIMQEFERLKRQRGYLDFTDLIERTRRLLTTAGASAWVLYKLDGGIDHILVDEAQDTSGAQWDIIKALTLEIFSGQGARADVTRTLFVVGDRKQSIFSFQGADPAAFDVSREHFEVEITESRQRFASVGLVQSFRSGPAVLSAVDSIFRDAAARQGLESSLDLAICHQAHRKTAAGLVELWPLPESDSGDEPPPLEPVDAMPADHPRRKLAQTIAEKISGWIGKRPLEAHGRTVEPGDILILVQRRNLLFEALIAALNKHAIPVAGADRLKLGEHIAVRDLLSLARFVILPEDDLSLAEVLKSPLNPESFDDDHLFAVAHGRDGCSLWHSLKASSHGATIAFLDRTIALSQQLTPFEFFNRILLDGDPSGRKRIYARLGPEAADAVDAFLDRVLDDELNYPPSLRGFICRFEAETIEIKRDMQNQGGEVRIMTVHGAKGLEANIVILADAADIPNSNADTALLMVKSGSAAAPLPFWSCKSDIRPAVVEQWKGETVARRMDEYRRLFYVALTRACDELYICGVPARGRAKDESWYRMVERAMTVELGLVPDSEGVLRYRGGIPAPLEEAQPKTGRAPGPLPVSLRQPLAVPYRARPWLRPSDPESGPELGPGRSPRDANDLRRFRRGILIHKLLQLLPGIDPDRRAAAAGNFMRRHAIADDDAEAIAAEVLGLLAHPDYAPFFATESLAEVPIITHFGGTPQSHRIDRLVVTPRSIHILDFKTDRSPPRGIDDTPQSYITQLGHYARAMAEIYPDRTITAALLWTVVPRFVIIPAEVLQATA